MEERELNEMMLRGAKAAGICAEGYRRLWGQSKAEMLRYYICNPDWCMERDYPTLSVLRREFWDCEGWGVYVDRVLDGEVLGERQAYVFHHCRGRVRVRMSAGQALIPMLYFGNGCDMDVVCENESGVGTVRVPLYVMGDNAVRTSTVGDGACFVRYEKEVRQ